MSRLELHLLGDFQVTLDGNLLTGFRSEKVRALLAYLAIESGHSHQRTALAGLLWGDSTGASALSSLRTALHNLRQLLDPLTGEWEAAGLIVTRTRVQFHPPSPPHYWSDLAEFDALAVRPPPHGHADGVCCDTCLARLTRMAQLYGGDLLGSFTVSDALEFETWYTIQRETRHRQACDALHALIVHHNAVRDYPSVARYARRILVLEPWLEADHRHLMRALALTNQRGAALAQYQACTRVLHQEFDALPDQETTMLYERIRSGRLGWEGEPGVGPQNPYQGLEAFDRQDALDFFGREALIKRLLARLGVSEGGAALAESWETRFVALIGPSGSGKSSVVQAGLISEVLRITKAAGRPWLVAQMRPGADPVANLAAALAATLSVEAEVSAAFEKLLHTDPTSLAHILATYLEPEHQLLLVLDQAEEFFTLVPDRATLEHVSNLLLNGLQAPEGHMRQITVMRADYYALPLGFPRWGQLFHERMEVTLPLTPEALRQVIVGPAERVGVAVEPELVTAMVTSAGQATGALPLLQYTLTELFERREGNLMTQRAYEALGGMAGALARRAEALYHQLAAEEQQIARQVFLRLVVPQEERVTVRRKVAHSALFSLAHPTAAASVHAEAVKTILDTFGRYRLLTFDRDAATGEPTIEIAHEALIDAWDRLSVWVTEAKETLYRHRRLEALAETWEQAGRDPSYLLRGRQLSQFEELPAGTDLALSAAETAYLEASLHEREQRQAAEAARQAREAALKRRAQQRRRALSWVLAVATVVALSLATYAFTQRRSAVESQLLAEQEAAIAQSLNLATSAQLALADHNTDLALALAVVANRIPDSPPQAQLMLADAAYAPGTRRVLEGHEGPVEGLALSADGRMAISASADHTLILWDLETGEMTRRFTGHRDVIHDVALHPNGDTALSASADGTLIQWSLESGQVVRRFNGHTDGVWCVAISPDGRTALSGSADHTLILWNVETGQILRHFTGHSDAVLSVAISPDGKKALSGSNDHSVIVWNIASSDIVHHFFGQDDVLEATTYDPRGHFDAVWGVAFSPDGQQAISAGYDEHTMVWDLATGERTKDLILPEMTASIFSMAISPDGRTALLGMLDNRVGLLDLTQGKSLLRLQGHTGRVQAVAFTPDGRRALSGSADGTLRLWDLQSGVERRRIYGPLIGPGVDISPDGRIGLAATWSGDIWLWDIESGKMVHSLQGHGDMVFAGAYFTPDGERIVSGSGAIFGVSKDNTIRVWDVASGEEIQRFEGHSAQVWDIAISPDGRYAASGAHDGTLRLWDLETGQGSILLDVAPQAVRSVTFSPECVTSTEGCEPAILVGLARGQSSNPAYGLRLINVTTGQEMRHFEGHKEVVADVAFSPDGRMAVSGSADKQVILWETATGQSIHYLTGHAASVQAVAFSPNGQLIASGGAGQTVFLWDAATGDLLRHFVGHTEFVLEVLFTSDGKTLVSVGDDDTVREWQIDASQDALMDWIAANRHVPELTCEQQAQYRVEPPCDPTSLPTLDSD